MMSWRWDCPRSSVVGSPGVSLSAPVFCERGSAGKGSGRGRSPVAESPPETHQREPADRDTQPGTVMIKPCLTPATNGHTVLSDNQVVLGWNIILSRHSLCHTEYLYTFLTSSKPFLGPKHIPKTQVLLCCKI